MGTRLRRFTVQHCVGLLALFIALGGTSFAATRPPANSVGNKQLKRNAVTSAKIRNGQVKGPDIRREAVGTEAVADGSLLLEDFSAGALPALRGPAGAKGEIGARGPKGDRGAPGPSTGPAGGALAGSYPNPTLDVSGGPCARGRFVTGLSTLATLTCGPDSALFTALGQGALASNTTGFENSAVGVNALSSNTTGAFNSAIGESALENNTTANGNTAAGAFALFSNTTGEFNSAFGESALSTNVTGSNNSAVGENALVSNTTGASNSAVGRSALAENTSGADNSAVGRAALRANTTGGANAALGHDALHTNTAGSFNSAVGRNALGSNITGADNSAVGRNALEANTTGTANAAFGNSAGDTLTTGTNNTMLGTGAGDTLTGADSSNVAIANGGVAGDNNTIRIGIQGNGLGQQDRAFMAGVFGATSTGGSAVFVNSAGQLGTTTSSRRFKTSIHPLGSPADVLKLRPVSFLYKPGVAPRAGRQYGLIAEEVEKVFPDLVVDGRDGRPYTVSYQQLPVLLLAQLQREHARANRQQREIDRQQRQIQRLDARVRALARRR
jgi:hypothetical protein